VSFQTIVRRDMRNQSEIRKEKFEESKDLVEELLNSGLFTVDSSQSPARISLNCGQRAGVERATAK